MDLTRIKNIIRRFLWLFVLVAIVASITTYFATTSQPAIYEAKTRLLVGPSLDSPSPDLNSLRIGGQLIQTYTEVVASRPFLESVNNKLNEKVDPELLAGMIEAKQNTETRILTVFVRHHDPNQSVAIANAIAETLVEVSPSKDNTTALLRIQLSNQSQQLDQIISNSEASIDELEAKLVALGNAPQTTLEGTQANLEQQDLVIKQLADERNRLSETLRTLTDLYGVLRDTNTNQIAIIEQAAVVYPVNQNIPLRVAAAGLAGLILAVSVVFAFEYFSDTIRSPGDFNRASNVPLLSTIAQRERLEGSGTEQVVALSSPNSRAANSYRRAVAKLLPTVSGSTTPYSFLLSSVGSPAGEVTAEIVANLGIAFAQAGKQVAIVDAQFQNPQLTTMFEADEKPGLAEFLTVDSPTLKLLPVKDVTGVRFMPIGLAYEKSSGSALNAAKIANLIEKLQAEAEVILVAGAPIALFAESMNLAAHVDGVILVARYGDAHVKTVNEVVENLEDMNVPLAGVIFDSNESSFVTKRTAKNVFEKTPVVSEDSHV